MKSYFVCANWDNGGDRRREVLLKKDVEAALKDPHAVHAMILRGTIVLEEWMVRHIFPQLFDTNALTDGAEERGSVNSLVGLCDYCQCDPCACDENKHDGEMR